MRSDRFPTAGRRPGDILDRVSPTALRRLDGAAQFESVARAVQINRSLDAEELLQASLPHRWVLVPALPPQGPDGEWTLVAEALPEEAGFGMVVAASVEALRESWPAGSCSRGWTALARPMSAACRMALDEGHDSLVLRVSWGFRMPFTQALTTQLAGRSEGDEWSALILGDGRSRIRRLTSPAPAQLLQDLVPLLDAEPAVRMAWMLEGVEGTGRWHAHLLLRFAGEGQQMAEKRLQKAVKRIVPAGYPLSFASITGEVEPGEISKISCLSPPLFVREAQP